MKFSQIVFLITVFFFVTSCQNGVNQEREIEPQKNRTPSTDYQKTDEGTPVFERQEPAEKPLEKEVKKAKLKTIDTLKPLVAIP